MERGYVQVYTGDGKGKTTAMLGLALRAYGAGLRIYIGQFIKDGDYSEVKAIREYLPGVKLEQYGGGFIFGGPSRADEDLAAEGFKKAKTAVFSGLYDMVMLDEINVAVHLGLIDVADVVELIKNKPQNVELILTGRDATKEVIDLADLVSEITEVKHYFTKGIMARDGIEM